MPDEECGVRITRIYKYQTFIYTCIWQQTLNVILSPYIIPRSLYIFEEQEGAMAAISGLLCDVTVLTGGNHGNQFTAQVQIDEKEKGIEVTQEGVVSQW